jgi:2-methylisocitrate lyase-like PEP mutase family enzyme
MTNQIERAERFRALHEREGAFVIANAWDAGSARLLAGLGFEAIATTSAGFAWTLGRMDGQVARAEAIEHCRALSSAVAVPVSADLENCFAREPEEAAETIVLGAEAGLVGGSIEDSSGDASEPIYDFPLAVERVHAAAEAARSLGFPFVLTARAENFLHGRSDIDDTVRRLQAFESAGADVLYAPGLTTLEEVRQVAGALTKPLNVLASPLGRVTVAELAEAGAKRVSLGGALARAALTAALRAGSEMLERGSFEWSSGLVSSAELARLFGD